MTAPTKPMSLDEFLALPETEPATELIDGVPCQKPVGSEDHSQAQSNLLFLLRLHPATANGRSRVELSVRFLRTERGNLRVPDVSHYLQGHEDRSGAKYPARVPDLAAEVRSEGQSRMALRRRLQFLRGQGSTCTLLILPESHVVEVVDGERSWTATIDDTVTLINLDGFSFAVRHLFED